jgi:hypothetical protein
MALSKELLGLLACPKCRGPLAPARDQDGLVCRDCNVVYPVREDIPILLIEEAVPLDRWTGSSVED